MIENDDKKVSDKILADLFYLSDSECTNRIACNLLAALTDGLYPAGHNSLKLRNKFNNRLYNYYTPQFIYFLTSIAYLHLQYSAFQSFRLTLELRNTFGDTIEKVLTEE